MILKKFIFKIIILSLLKMEVPQPTSALPIEQRVKACEDMLASLTKKKEKKDIVKDQVCPTCKKSFTSIGLKRHTRANKCSKNDTTQEKVKRTKKEKKVKSDE